MALEIKTSTLSQSILLILTHAPHTLHAYPQSQEHSSSLRELFWSRLGPGPWLVTAIQCTPVPGSCPATLGQFQTTTASMAASTAH